MNHRDPTCKNTLNWQQSINKRKQLINRAESLGLPLGNPHNVKLADLEAYVENAEQRITI